MTLVSPLTLYDILLRLGPAHLYRLPPLQSVRHAPVNVLTPGPGHSLAHLLRSGDTLLVRHLAALGHRDSPEESECIMWTQTVISHLHSFLLASLQSRKGTWTRVSRVTWPQLHVLSSTTHLLSLPSPFHLQSQSHNKAGQCAPLTCTHSPCHTPWSARC